MAIAYSAVATNSTTGSTSLTATFGAAPAADAVLIAFVIARGGTARTLGATTGTWTSINRTDQGTIVAMETFWRLGDGSTTAFSFSNDSSSEDWQVAILSITGANTTTPIGGTAENSSTTGTGVTVTLTPTHASSGTPSLIAQGWGNTGNGTWTPDGSATERFDFKSNTFSNTSSGGGHDTTNATSTSNISRTWTASGSGANVAQMIEVRGADSGVSVTPAAATLNLSAPNPTVSLGATSVTPAAGVLSLAAVTPTVTLGATSVTPAAANLNLSAPDPTVEAGGGVSVTPAAAALNLSAPNPTVTLGSTSVAPAAGVLSLAAVTPTVTLGATAVTPAAATVQLSAPNPTVTLGATSVTPGAATVTLAAVSPTVTLGAVAVVPASARLDLSAASPTVTLGATAVTPAAAALLLSAVSPTVDVGGVLPDVPSPTTAPGGSGRTLATVSTGRTTAPGGSGRTGMTTLN